MKTKAIKKSDIILICSAILLGIIILSILAAVFLGKGETVVVKLDGNEYARLPLNEDTELLITSELGENLLVIENGEAYIKSATCPKQICVAHGKATELDPIVCKHNRVSVIIE